MKRALIAAFMSIGLATAGCVHVEHHKERDRDRTWCENHPAQCEGWCTDHPGECRDRDTTWCNAHPGECGDWCRDHPDRCVPRP
jgi:hypothetical protein